jgi:hypothetical protein
MDENEILKMYSSLPDKSNARLADNHERFEYFLNTSEPHPYMILCREQNTDKYTWHVACSQLPLHLWVKSEFRRLRQMDVSTERGRNLELVEAYTREGTHYFLD